MRHLIICILSIVPTLCFGQFREDFSDADAAYSAWSGDWGRFAINRSGQLQSQSAAAAESMLWRESIASIDAEWSGWVRISGTCSAYNLVRCYLTLNGDSLQADAYYVQIGGANKNIVLYEQSHGNISKVIGMRHARRFSMMRLQSYAGALRAAQTVSFTCIRKWKEWTVLS